VLLGVCQFLYSEPFGEKLFSSVFCLLFYFLCLVYSFFSSFAADGCNMCVIEGSREGAELAENIIRNIITIEEKRQIKSSEMLITEVCNTINS
jgi:hypothetical protein